MLYSNKISVLFSLVFLVFLSSKIHAQTINMGDNMIHFGLGVGQTYKIPYTSVSNKTTSFGPVTAGYETIITDLLGVGRIGVGGSLGFSSYSRHYQVSEWIPPVFPITGGIQPGTGIWRERDAKNTATVISIMGRGSYHFDLPVDGLDLYAGMGIGLYVYSYKYDSSVSKQASTSSSSLFVNYYAGARYFFSPSFGIYGELGYGMGILNIGATLRF